MRHVECALAREELAQGPWISADPQPGGTPSDHAFFQRTALASRR